MPLCERTNIPNVYWLGKYSECHQGGEIELFIKEQQCISDKKVILLGVDGLMSDADYDTHIPEAHAVVCVLATRTVKRPNIVYIPLDDGTFARGLTDVLSQFALPTWESRKPIAFWRGACTGVESGDTLRMKLVASLEETQNADAKITRWYGFEKVKNVPTISLCDRVPFQVHFQHKYIFIVDGNSIASNQQWVFGSGAVPIMITHPQNEFWFKRFLIPGVHYMAVEYDLSNLNAVIEWLVSHDAEAKQIAENAIDFSRRVFSPEFQKQYLRFALRTACSEIDSIQE